MMRNFGMKKKCDDYFFVDLQYGSSCQFSSSNVGATISPKYAVTRLASGDVNTAMAYLANRTAISSGLIVGFEFEHYQKYIFLSYIFKSNCFVGNLKLARDCYW